MTVAPLRVSYTCFFKIGLVSTSDADKISQPVADITLTYGKIIQTMSLVLKLNENFNSTSGSIDCESLYPRLFWSLKWDLDKVVFALVDTNTTETQVVKLELPRTHGFWKMMLRWKKYYEKFHKPTLAAENPRGLVPEVSTVANPWGSPPDSKTKIIELLFTPGI